MPEHHDQRDTRIIPLLPHLQRRASKRTSRTTRDVRHPELLMDSSSTDRLVRVDAALPPLMREADGVSHMTSLKLGVSSGAFYPHIPTEYTPLHAAALGFAEMEIMLQTIGEYEKSFAHKVATNARAAGIAIRSVHTMEPYHRVLSPYEPRAEEGRMMMSKAIALANIVGARYLVWHGPLREEVQSDEGWAAFIREAQAIAKECEQHGITLALENVGRSALGRVRDVTAFASTLAEFESDAIGFVFDPFQAAEAGANPFMVLTAMGNRVVDVHISDYKEDDPSQRHLPPGDGDLPWSALLRAIAGSGYDGPLIIEGVLGRDEETLARVHAHLDPLIRSVFAFAPRQANEADIPIPTVLPAGVLEGIRLFNEHRFFEQHEVIEHEWHAERSSIRTLYQGILQIGVGYYHALRGNQRGAVTLLTDGISKVRGYIPDAMGIDTGRLVRESERCLEQLQVLGEANIAAFEPELIPRIHMVEA